MKILEKLEDFRLLPFFVLFSMAVGILIGKILGISNFELTPPIEAIKQIFRGTFVLSIPNAISLGVPIGLFFMIYPAMTNVRVEDLKLAVKSPKQIGFAPFFMYALAKMFLAQYPDLRTGLILYGFAPCTSDDSYSILFQAPARRYTIRCARGWGERGSLSWHAALAGHFDEKERNK